MNNIKFIVVDRGEIEIGDDVKIPISFSVADLTDITTRSGASSKTITVNGTSNNNLLFAQLFNIRSSDYLFDLTKKYSCVLSRNGAEFFRGYMKLDSITKTPNSNSTTDDINIKYNITVFDETVSFFNEVESKLLEDIDFNITPHYLTYDYILATSANTYMDVYKYFTFYNNGSTDYTHKNMWPSIYAKQYADRIIADAGFYYDDTESSFMIEDPFTKLVIPSTGNVNFKDEEVWENEKFFGAHTGTTATTFNYGTTLNQSADFNNYVYPFYNNAYSEPGDNIYTAENGGSQDFLIHMTGTTTYTSDVDVWYGDVYGKTIASASTYNRLKQVPVTVALFVNGVQVQAVNMYSEMKLPVNDNWSPTVPDMVAGEKYDTTYTVDALFSNINVLAGDEVTVKFRVNPYKAVPAEYGFYDYSGTTSYPGVVTFNFANITYPTGTFSFNYATWTNIPNLTTARNYGDIVLLNDYIPKNVKQKDFLSNLLKIFNVYIDSDKNFSNKLVFKTRDEYYNNYLTENWSSKIDRKKEIVIEYIPELTKRSTILKFNDGDDDFTKLYKENFNKSYGEKEITYNIEKAVGEDKKEFLFTNSPIVYNGNLRVPAINSIQNKNLEVLYDGGMVSGSWRFNDQYFTYQEVQVGTLIEQNWLGVITTTPIYETVATAHGNNIAQTSYPYAGHWDNPDLPSFDLNFDVAESYFVDNNYYTDNNLFNLYHYNTYRNISEQKKMTAYFYLSEMDIAKLNMSQKVIVDNVTYIINKISDWDASSPASSVKVELVVFDSIYKQKPVKKKPIRISAITISADTHRIKPLINPNNTIHPQANINILIGKNNTISNIVDEAVIINSDNNNIGADTKNLTLINSKNNILNDIDNSFLVGVSDSVFTTGVTNTFMSNYDNFIINSTNILINNTSLSAMTDGYWTSGSTGIKSIRTENGTGTDATGDYAVAEGSNTLASGTSAHAEGSGTTAGGIFSHAEGYDTLAIGAFAHAEGGDTTASGDYGSHAEGFGTIASGTYGAHAEGINTIASGDYSHSEGSNTTASGNQSHAEGFDTTASGNSSHAEGWRTYTNGEYSHAEGYETTANGDASHAEGFITTASGSSSHAEGFYTNANGFASHAGGSQSTASGLFSFAHGRNCVATSTGTTVIAANTVTGTEPYTLYTDNLRVTHEMYLSGTQITPTKYITLPIVVNPFSPNDSTSYYFGCSGGAPATSATRRRIYCWKAGTINIANIWSYASTAGSNESISLYVRKNNATNTLIETESVSAVQRNWENVSLGVTVASGDYVEILMICPAWATNPVFQSIGGYLVLETVE